MRCLHASLVSDSNCLPHSLYVISTLLNLTAPLTMTVVRKAVIGASSPSGGVPVKDRSPPNLAVRISIAKGGLRSNLRLLPPTAQR